MVKVKARQDFYYKDFKKVKALQRTGKDEQGKIFKGDIFNTTEEMCDYLSGGNNKGLILVEVIEFVKETKKNKTVPPILT